VRLGDGRLRGLAGVTLWLGLAAVLCTVLTRGWSPPDGASHGASWALLALALLALLPYLVRSLRALRGRDEITIEAEQAGIARRGERLAAAGEVRALRLRAVNGTCQELTLSAELKDGRRLVLYESGVAGRVSSKAREAAALLGVELIRE